MAKPLKLILVPDQRETLEIMRDTDPHPYARERAAALLKLADEEHPQSGRQVALHGLLKPRQPDTIYAWVRRFQAQGVKGLIQRPGRGRKPAFSPSTPDGRPRPRGPAPSRPAGPPRTG